MQVEADQRAQDCLMPMGITSENVAERYGISRKQQDAAAVRLPHLPYLSIESFNHKYQYFCQTVVPPLLHLWLLVVHHLGCFLLSWQVRSHQKAAAARASGRFKDEIIPIHTKVRLDL